MREVIRLSMPLTVWLVSFSALYGLQGFVCAAGWAASPGPAGLAWGRLLMLAAVVVATGLQAMILFLIWSERLGGHSGFMHRTTLTLAVAGLVAALWTFAPAAILPTCDGEGWQEGVWTGGTGGNKLYR